MTALRVLHVDTGRGWRGGQAQVDLLVRALAGRGHAQAVAAPPDSPLRRRVATCAETIAFAPRSDLDLPAALALLGAARRFRPDVVHLHDARAHATGWLAARALGAGCIVSRRVALAGAGRRPHAWKYRRLAADRWHAISHAVARELAGLGIAPGRIAVVPDALDVVASARAVAHAQAEGRARALRIACEAAAPGTVLVGVIAALTAEKGHADLLDAFARVARERPVRLVVVGEGTEEAGLKARAKTLGLAGRIVWLGRSDDVAPVLAALDGLVVPSRAEGFGSIVLLAHAAAVPVVATAVGGLPEAIEDGVTGRLVPPGDVAALAFALEELARDPAGSRARAQVAREQVGRFDIGAIAPRFEALYAESRRPEPGAERQPDAAAPV